MAGETAHFDLRKRGSTPAVRPFDVTPTPMLKSMLDRAHTALAEPYWGIVEGADIVPALFARERTGVSLGSLLEAAQSFLNGAHPAKIEDEAWRRWSNKIHGLMHAGRGTFVHKTVAKYKSLLVILILTQNKARSQQK